MRVSLPVSKTLDARTSLGTLSWQSVRPQWSSSEGWKLIEAWSTWSQASPSTAGGAPFVLGVRPAAAGGWGQYAQVACASYVRVCMWCCECDLQVANADDAANTVTVRVSDIERPIETHNQMVVELDNGGSGTENVNIPIPFGATSMTFDARTGTSPGTLKVYNGTGLLVGTYEIADLPAGGVSLAGVAAVTANGFPSPVRFIFDLSF